MSDRSRDASKQNPCLAATYEFCSPLEFHNVGVCLFFVPKQSFFSGSNRSMGFMTLIEFFPLEDARCDLSLVLFHAIRHFGIQLGTGLTTGRYRVLSG